MVCDQSRVTEARTLLMLTIIIIQGRRRPTSNQHPYATGGNWPNTPLIPIFATSIESHPFLMTLTTSGLSSKSTAVQRLWVGIMASWSRSRL